MSESTPRTLSQCKTYLRGAVSYICIRAAAPIHNVHNRVAPMKVSNLAQKQITAMQLPPAATTSAPLADVPNNDPHPNTTKSTVQEHVLKRDPPVRLRCDRWAPLYMHRSPLDDAKRERKLPSKNSNGMLCGHHRLKIMSITHCQCPHVTSTIAHTRGSCTHPRRHVQRTAHETFLLHRPTKSLHCYE